MKKKVLIVASVMACLASFAQEKAADSGEELKGRNSQPILPKAGDIALGFNAVPMIDWMLVTVSRNQNGTTPTTQNAAQYTSGSNSQIVGKYFLDAKTAVRVRFSINNIAGSVTNKVQDAAAMGAAVNGTQDDRDAARLFTVDDKMTFKKMNSQISVGIEKRRGYGRLQGFYGAEIGLGRISSSEKVSYGNAFSDQWNVEYTSNFNGASPTAVLQTPLGGRQVRLLEAKFQTGMRYGARAFVGAEYFFFPKISIGAEFGWGYSIATNGNQKAKYEVYVNGQNGPATLIEDDNTVSSNKSRGWSIDNNQNAILNMNNNTAGTNSVFGNANQGLNAGFGSASGAIILLIHF